MAQTAALTNALDTATVSYREPSSGVRMVFARPETRPDLWAAYLQGLEQTYVSFGTERALDLRAIFVGRQLPMFVVAVDDSGQVLAGVRAHGPLIAAEEAHALVEFEIDPIGARTVRNLIDDRIARGVTEIKGGWVAEDAPNRRELSNALARTFIHIMTLLEVDFAFCTAADHAARRWLTVGGRPVDGLAPVAYPDERYRTTMMWWNQASYAEHCDADQLRHIQQEALALGQAGRRAPHPVPMRVPWAGGRIAGQPALAADVA
jgi:hypothetical protein